MDTYKIQIYFKDGSIEPIDAVELPHVVDNILHVEIKYNGQYITKHYPLIHIYRYDYEK
jgi:hypothetical protein